MGRPAVPILCFLLLACLAQPFAQSPYSKSTITFPADPFAVPSGNGSPGWVKFTILVDDPTTVIFQDSQTYPFHYDFAVAELEPFAGMSPAEFDAVTLFEEGQLAILGSVILPPLVGYNHVWQEYGIQFVRQDAYPPAQVVDLFHAVESAVIAGPQVQAFYFPTFEQQASAAANQAFFESQGVHVSSTARWAEGNSCYSNGWALGELTYFDADQIDAAYLAGDLLPGDVLLTDAVPAEIPLVAGVVSLSPSTPSSHVAILAQSYGIPFAHLAVADDAQTAQDLVGHDVVLRVEPGRWLGVDSCVVRLIDVEGRLDPPTVDAILALKDPPPLDITPMEPFGAYSSTTDVLQPADIRYFGGKAAHFGLLRQAIPVNSPVAVAFSFDVWNSFMDQVLANSNTLRQEIAQRLSGFAYPPDVSALESALADVRDLIKDEGQTAFAPIVRFAIRSALQDPQYGFDPAEKLRFRSSTNVEDSDQFTGAGLYDSFNGCLADDLDGDGVGPSVCDPSEPEERGVFRAIRRVFASFYNLNATVERLYRGVDESQVGMALLVHHSFPDELEMANGVATMEQFSATYRDAYLVTQAGSSSVTNPEPGAVAEEVDVWISNGFDMIYPTLIRPSNLVPLGATVMTMTDDYIALTELLLPVTDGYAAATGLTQFLLEFEYKKLAPAGDLIVKQVRRVPQADDTPSVTPFLINEPTEYCSFQGEYGDVFANHRLKSRWTLETLNLWLTEPNLQSSFFADATLQYSEACQLYEQSGLLPQWPQGFHTFDAGEARDGWSFDNLQNPRIHELTTPNVPLLVAPSESPLLVLGDFGWPADYSNIGCLTWTVRYDRPVPSVDWTGPIMTTSESALLCRCPEPRVGDLLQERTFDGPAGVTVDTSFYWPPPADVAAGYTAPVSRFVETVITGLTSAPLVLHAEYSQTYRPEHHNFGENFIFEPALDLGVSQQQLDELEAADVRAIYVESYYATPEFTIFSDAEWGHACLPCTGFDGDGDDHCTGEPTFDCDDANPEVWSTPGEVRALHFTDPDTLEWSRPSEMGGSSVVYDTLRSTNPADFLTSPACIESNDGTDTTADDADDPGPGELACHLSRAENACPDGVGSLGTDSDGAERQGADCP